MTKRERKYMGKQQLVKALLGFGRAIGSFRSKPLPAYFKKLQVDTANNVANSIEKDIQFFDSISKA